MHGYYVWYVHFFILCLGFHVAHRVTKSSRSSRHHTKHRADLHYGIRGWTTLQYFMWNTYSVSPLHQISVFCTVITPHLGEVWWSVAKCCSVVMFFWFFFSRFVYGCMFCILSFNSVSCDSYYYVYVLLLTCMLCSVYSLPSGILRLPWLRVFHVFFSVVKQMPGYTLQKRGTVRTLPN
jgi:hypothetical protein